MGLSHGKTRKSNDGTDVRSWRRSARWVSYDIADVPATITPRMDARKHSEQIIQHPAHALAKQIPPLIPPVGGKVGEQPQHQPGPQLTPRNKTRSASMVEQLQIITDIAQKVNASKTSVVSPPAESRALDHISAIPARAPNGYHNKEPQPVVSHLSKDESSTSEDGAPGKHGQKENQTKEISNVKKSPSIDSNLSKTTESKRKHQKQHHRRHHHNKHHHRSPRAAEHNHNHNYNHDHQSPRLRPRTPVPQDMRSNKNRSP